MATEEKTEELIETANLISEEKEKTSNNNDTEERIEIGVYCYANRVNDVSIADQNFHAFFQVEFQWLASKEDYDAYLANPNDYQPISWKPDFICGNGKFDDKNNKGNKIISITDPKLPNKDSWNIEVKKIRFDSKDIKYGINLAHYELEGDFNEKFELENFPFDCQDLQLLLRPVGSLAKVIFAPPIYTDIHCGGLALASSQLDNYIVHTPLIEYDCIDHGYDDGDQSKTSMMTFRMKLERKYKIYFAKIVLFVFITSVSSLIVFTMDAESISDRYGTLLTLLLTMVAFQFVVESQLPQLPYLTFIDYYITVSFVFLFLMIIQTAIFSVIAWDDEENAVDFDVVSIIVLTGFFIIYHIYFGIAGYRARNKELEKLTMDGADYKKLELEDKGEEEKMYFDTEFDKHVMIGKKVSHILDSKRYSDIKPPK